MAEAVRFSSAMLPERERYGYWREVIARHYLKMDSEALRGVPFHVEMHARELPGLVIGEAYLSGTRERRTKALMSDGMDDFGFCINLSGDYLVQHRGEDILIGPGQAALQSGVETTIHARPGRGGGLAVRMPRKAFEHLVPHPDDLVERVVPADNAALQLFRDYAAAADRMPHDAPAAVQRAVAEHLCDLVALTLWSAFGSPVHATRAGMRAATLHRIKRDILHHLGRPSLSLQATAQRHGMTPRSLQRLFEAHGTSFSQFVLEQRLTRAAAMLRNPRQSGRTIVAIATECGFGDISTFNRMFRRRFGASPSEIRNRGA